MLFLNSNFKKLAIYQRNLYYYVPLSLLSDRCCTRAATCLESYSKSADRLFTVVPENTMSIKRNVIGNLEKDDGFNRVQTKQIFNPGCPCLSRVLMA